MKLLLIKILFVINVLTLSAQNQFLNEANFYIPAECLEKKIGSGDLIKRISENKNSVLSEASKIDVVLYTADSPSAHFLEELSRFKVDYFLNTWTPATGIHPFGFFFAKIDVSFIDQLVELDELKKIDIADEVLMPQGNNAVKLIKADLAWLKGYKGKGIRVAIIDSGLDTEPFNQDLPSVIIKKDYSNYPTLTDNVENNAISHGTHVTSALLGNGNYSEGNSVNGADNYTGVAPEVELIFLKVGNNINGAASHTAIVYALDAAVNTYNADVINLSYGFWDRHHDGTSSQDQKVDWCYSMGVPVFLASGNSPLENRHYSGNVSGNDSSEFIRVDVRDAGENSTYLYLNLVWFDGLDKRDNLFLQYYDSDFQPITRVWQYATSESILGTESKTSQILSKSPAGNSTYYVKVINQSSNPYKFNIYEHLNDGKVTFANPDPNYTITSPATATYGFSVGAYTSRESWTAANGYVGSFGETLNNIASFSGRGPRVDGLQKPDIVAPGSGLITLRDRDVQTTQNNFWIDNDGVPGGDANYYIVSGTSYASPVAAGGAAILLQKFPDASPIEIFNALRNNAIQDDYTGIVPNSAYGYGKLDVAAALDDPYLLGKYSVSVNTKLLLQGAYSGNEMRTDLSDHNLIPLSQPYNSAPWNYTGDEIVSSIPSDVVDWILLELRTYTSINTVAGKRAAFLKKDGTIVDLDGSSQVRFYGVTAGDYYLVANHRNHLSVMSSEPISFSISSELYDFTSDINSAYRSGSEPMKLMSSGNYALFAGDVNGDGILSYSGPNNDRAAILSMLGGNEISASLKGYYHEDVDMNGFVHYYGEDSDYNLILTNIGSDDITLIRKSQVPLQ